MPTISIELGIGFKGRIAVQNRTAEVNKEAVMYLAVKSVKPLENYKLLLKFENKEERIFDLTSYLNWGKFSELNDVSLFNSVKISFDTIAWANHLDLDPEFLYGKSASIESEIVDYH